MLIAGGCPSLVELDLSLNHLIHTDWEDFPTREIYQTIGKATVYNPSFKGVNSVCRGSTHSPLTRLDISENSIVRYGQEGPDAIALMVSASLHTRDLHALCYYAPAAITSGF
jgi:hypothetical protein